MVAERRKERRLRAKLPLRISYPDNPPIDSHTENISRLGTYFEIEQEIPLGIKLDMTIEVPVYTNGLPLIANVRCRGDVFRCSLVKEVESKRSYGLGVFFTDFSDEEDRNKLSKYIDLLIFKEKEDIKQGIQRWKEKRRKRRSQKKS